MQTQPGLHLPQRDSKTHIHAELPRVANTAWRTACPLPGPARDPRIATRVHGVGGWRGCQRSAERVLCRILEKIKDESSQSLYLRVLSFISQTGETEAQRSKAFVPSFCGARTERWAEPLPGS